MISGVVLSSIVGMLDDFAVLKVDSLTNAPFCSLIFFHGHIIGVVTTYTHLCSRELCT